MAAIDKERRVLAERARKVGALQRALVKPDHQQADTASDPLDNGIGGKRGRQRDKSDIGCAAVKILENPLDGTADADGQVIACGQRFSGCADSPGGGVEKGGIGIGAAGIKPDHKSHGTGSGWFRGGDGTVRPLRAFARAGGRRWRSSRRW